MKDIDPAVVSRELEDSFDMQVQLMKLRRKIDIRIEPHPFLESDFDDSNLFGNYSRSQTEGVPKAQLTHFGGGRAPFYTKHGFK